MDTPTHALINRVIARRIWPGRDDNATVNLITIMGVLPDIDTLFAGDDLDYIQEHRGITHSILGAAVAAAVVAVVAGRLGVKGSYRSRYLISFVGMMLHILFDVFTSYGTQVLAPLSDYRFAIDVLFIIDPYLTGILILTLVVGWRSRPEAYRIGFVVFVAYVGMNVALLGYGYQQAAAWADRKGIAADRVGVLPSPFSPLYRRGFVESGVTTYWITIPALGNAGETVVTYPRALAQPNLDFVWDTVDGSTYRWFARYPVLTSVKGSEVIVEDLSFRISASGLGWLGNAALDWAQASTPEFLDRKLFYLEVDTESGEVVFRRR